MEDDHHNRLREMPRPFEHEPLSSAQPYWPKANKPLRLKIFKSGNSLALRLPASLGLEAGMEMDLTIEPHGGYSLRPADAPKRKIDVSKFAGKAPWLKELPPEMREFEHRELDWHLFDNQDKSA
jgi:antitoxin VapB